MRCRGSRFINQMRIGIRLRKKIKIAMFAALALASAGCGSKLTVEQEYIEGQTETAESGTETAAQYKQIDIYDPYETAGVNLAPQAVCSTYRSGEVLCYTVSERKWPQELIAYLKEGLLQKKITEYLDVIPADYIILEEKEKEALSKKQNQLAYFSELFDEDAVWYQADLSEAGEDLVVCCQLDGGYELSYIFVNDKEYGYINSPITGGGQKKSAPYFICWENINYVVFPYWDKAQEEIIGIAVYDHHIGAYVGTVAGIWRNSDGTVQIKQQECWRVPVGKESQFQEYSLYVPMLTVF